MYITNRGTRYLLDPAEITTDLVLQPCFGL